MSGKPKSILNSYIAMTPARDIRTGRFQFIYPRVERKSALVEQLILYDSVYIATSHFRELKWLSSWLPFAVLEDLLVTKAVNFIFNPWLILDSGGIGSNQLGAARMLDVCGLPSTIPDKVIEALKQNSQYEQTQVRRIAHIIDDSISMVSQRAVEQAVESARADISNSAYLNSSYQAVADFMDELYSPVLKTKGLAERLSTILHQSKYQTLDLRKMNHHKGNLIALNEYLAIMSELGDLHLFAPSELQTALEHKLGWLAKRVSYRDGIRPSLSFLFKAVDVPDIRRLFLEHQIDVTDIARLRRQAEGFRRWIHIIADGNGEDALNNLSFIQAYIASLETEPKINQIPSKIVRFLVTTLIGLIPGASLISAGVSAFDTFLLEKFTQGWQPKVFLSELRRFGSRKKMPPRIDLSGT